MRGWRSTRATVTLILLVLLISAVGPAAAGANPLLSGYGGPGQGSQAILGAALVGGRSGGGSSGGGSGGESPSGLALVEGRANGSHPSRARVRARGAVRAAGASVTGHQITGGASNSDARTYPHESSLNTSRTASGSSPALGLSGADVMYILLALGVLILTAVLTRRLVRQPG